MCSRIPIKLVIQMEENFIIRVLAKALSEVTNCSPMALENLGPYRIAQPRVIFVLMNITLSRLDLSHRSNSATSTSVLFSATSGGSDFLMV